MTRRAAGALALLALGAAVATLALALTPAAQARTVRVFAVGPKLSPDWLDTRAHYRDKLFALVDRRRRRAPAPPIQRGADDVASHLLGPADPADPRRVNATARDLVTLPEDVGLVTLFTGPRGAAARQVTPEQGLTGAVIALLGTYQPVISLYTARYPSLATRPLPTRALALALTDVFARVGVETFAAIADRYDVYLEAGVNMARRWRIVCADRSTFRPPPTGEGCAVQSPTLVQALRDPGDPARDYAYQATTSQPVNMALVFGPDGRLISRQVKSYLTPTELPEALDLVPGDVSGLGAVRTPVGTLGFVTSKDAWMPDVTAKLDARHVDVLVQPEFFVNDTVAPAGMWAPDTLIASGWSDVLRHPSLEALVLPEMTGNLIDNSADAQQHLVRKPRGRVRARGSLVGQPLLPGFARVQDWVVPDPRDAPFPARRRRLGLAGQTLVPLGDGPACQDPRVAGPCRNGQVEGVLYADVDVPRRPAYRPRPRRTTAASVFTTNRPIRASGDAQRNVALAARGRLAWAVFEERRGTRDVVVLARSADAGAAWSPVVAAPAGAGAGPRALWPSIAVGPDGRVWVAWTDDRSGVQRAYLSFSDDGGRRFAPARAIDATAPRGVHQWRPSIASATRRGAVVAWIDERGRSADDDLPQAQVRLATVSNGRPGGSRRIDQEMPVPLAAKLDNAWAPSIAARGRRVAVAWIDFRTYDWRVHSRASADGGASFGAERTVSPPGDVEVLDDSPRAAIGPRGDLVAFTDWRKRASSAQRPHQAYDTLLGMPGGAAARVDDHGSRQASTFSPWPVALADGGALVAFQDASRGVNAVRVARVDAAGRRRGTPSAVSDAGAAPWNQWRPALALVPAGQVLAAWEDERDGPAQVFAARAPVARIGGTPRPFTGARR